MFSKSFRLFSLVCCLSCLPFAKSFAQYDNMDSIHKVLTSNIDDTQKVHALILIMEADSPDNPAYADYNEQMKKLIDKNRGADKAYQKTYDNFLGRYYINKAGTMFSKSRSHALELCDSAIAMFRKAGDESNAAYSLTNKGMVYEGLLNFDKAIESYFESLKSFERLGNAAGKSYALQSIAKAYSGQKNYPKAIEYYKEVLTEFDKRKKLTPGESFQQIVTWYSLSDAYISTKNLTGAEDCLTKAIASAKETQAPSTVSIVMGKLAELRFKQGRNAESISLFEEAMKNSQDDFSMSANLTGLGELYVEEKQYAKAIPVLEKALDLSKQSGVQAKIRNAGDLLYKAYKGTGQFEKALAAHEIFTAAKDSIKKEEAANSLKENQIKYDFEKKELLTKIDTDKERTRKNILLYSMLGLAFILALGIFFLYKYFKQKNIISANKNNELKQKLLLTQMNPHFIFNSVDNIQSLIYNKQDEEAVNYLTKFSKLTRQILENSRENHIPLSEELNMLDNYMAVQKLLYNNSFTYSITVEDGIDPDAILLPPMLTQPFIENAVKHGLKNKESGGLVLIRFYKEHEQLFFEVTDNGSGMVENPVVKHKSLSTEITKERLKGASGKRNFTIQTMNITGIDNKVQGVKTFFEIPYIYNN